MRRVTAFEMVSADGFYEGPDGEIDWHRVDPEFERFAIEQVQSAEALLMGRVTYELMASYWPTPIAFDDNDRAMISAMNDTPKIVFSRSEIETPWANSRLMKGEATEAVARLKEESGSDLLVLGSSILLTGLIDAGLLDELILMVNPVLLGQGRPMVTGLTEQASLELLNATAFSSGNVALRYRPETHPLR